MGSDFDFTTLKLIDIDSNKTNVSTIEMIYQPPESILRESQRLKLRNNFEKNYENSNG